MNLFCMRNEVWGCAEIVHPHWTNKLRKQKILNDKWSTKQHQGNPQRNLFNPVEQERSVSKNYFHPSFSHSFAVM